MATAIVMPKLGLTMTAGAVTLWLVDEGQHVAAGDIVVEITTEKITYQVEASVSGVLLKIVVEEGDDIPIGTLIGVIGEAGEDISGLLAGGAGPPRGDESTGTASPAHVSTVPAGAPPGQAATAAGDAAGVPSGRVLASPAARKLALELGVDLAGVSGSGPRMRITTEDVTAAAELGAAAERGASAGRGAAADLGPTAGRGAAAEGGAAAERGAPDAAPGLPHAAPPEAAAAQTLEVGRWPSRTVRRTIAYTGVRRTIGEHMAASRNASPTVTHHVRADLHELIEALSRFNEGRPAEESISITAAIVKAVAAAIESEPAINATLTDDVISVWEAIDIGVAVAVPHGLIVPVIRDANAKGAAQVARELRDLARRAREGGLLPDETTGGTFTVTSLGGYGSVDWFTPIINQPEAAILGVGRVIDEVVAVNRSIVVRHTVGLSLTFDHRIIDGAPAAGFLKVLLARLEAPENLLA
ncbi:MAG: dihydrolipoamide acetyltransferase family protein [Thermoleophilia bacterium]